MKNRIVRGYKVFNADWTCRPNGKKFQYEVGKTYEDDFAPKLCSRGFHFCENAVDCFNYYAFNPKNKVAEIHALGDVTSDGVKSCTNKIQIVREIPWAELLEMVNTGKGCTGYRNSGDWNKCSFSNGCFNTESPKIYLFNKPSPWTYVDWLHSKAYFLLNQISENTLKYRYFTDMTDEEKAEHPEAETTGGYLLKSETTDKEHQMWWNELSSEDKEEIKSIPNFDKEIFKEITGIDVD